MLIITRNIKEVLTIGKDIKIVILDVYGNKVQMGILAPDHLPIRRKETQQHTKKAFKCNADIDISPLKSTLSTDDLLEI